MPDYPGEIINSQGILCTQPMAIAQNSFGETCPTILACCLLSERWLWDTAGLTQGDRSQRPRLD